MYVCVCIIGKFLINIFGGELIKYSTDYHPMNDTQQLMEVNLPNKTNVVVVVDEKCISHRLYATATVTVARVSLYVCMNNFVRQLLDMYVRRMYECVCVCPFPLLPV